MNQKSIYSPRVVVASQQGAVIHIKSKQTGKVLLKLKLMSEDGEDELLLDMCGNGAGYEWTDHAAEKIAAFENGGQHEPKRTG